MSTAPISQANFKTILQIFFHFHNHPPSHLSDINRTYFSSEFQKNFQNFFPFPKSSPPPLSDVHVHVEAELGCNLLATYFQPTTNHNAHIANLGCHENKI